VNDAIIDSKGRYFGSLIYEEFTTEELSLNFFSAQTEQWADQKANQENATRIKEMTDQ